MAYHNSLRYYVTTTMIIRKMWKEHIMASEKQTMLKYVNPISTTSKYSFLYKQHEQMFSPQISFNIFIIQTVKY